MMMHSHTRNGQTWVWSGEGCPSCAQGEPSDCTCSATGFPSKPHASGSAGCADFNREWAAMKNEAADREREQEAAAFMADSETW